MKYLVLLIILTSSIVIIASCNRKAAQQKAAEPVTQQPPSTPTPPSVPDQKPTPDGKDQATLLISIKRTPCYGQCPSYECHFYDDGSVIYKGQKHVEMIGEFHGLISPKAIRALHGEAEQMGFLKYQRMYPTNPAHVIVDLPTVQLKIQFGRTSKKVIMSSGIPEELMEYVNTVEQTIKRVSWKEKDRKE